MDNCSSRIYDCYITGKETGTVEQFAERMKNDWNKRAERNPNFYIIGYGADEEWVSYTGKLDFEKHFLPRFYQLYPYDTSRISTILEIGCGICRMSEYISSYCEQLIAADISSEFLTIGKKRLDNKHINNVDYTELNGYSLAPIMSNYVDFAFEYIVFQHIGSFDIIKSYLKDIGRVLKSGGYFVMHALANDETAKNAINLGNTFHGCNVTYELMQDAINEIKELEIVEQQIFNSNYWGIIRKK